MRFKPKTVRRLLLVAVVAVVIVGGAFSLFVVRRWQTNRRTEAHRREGMAAFAAGNYRKCVEDLGKYIHRGHANDADVWLTVARASHAVEQPDNAHLRNTIKALQQYLTLRPDDSEQRLWLLKICNQAGSYLEARDAARLLRPEAIETCGPALVEVLREEAIALTAARQDGDRLEGVVARLLALSPLDLQGHLIRLEFWGRSERKQEARQGAMALAAAHPESPVAQLVLAASYLVEPTPDDIRAARAKLAQAVGLDPISGEVTNTVALPGADFTSRAVDILDRLQAFDFSFHVLKQWRMQNPTAPNHRLELGLLRTLARRLWQVGDHDGLDSLITPQDQPLADSEVLAFIAMALSQSDRSERKARSESILKTLQARTQDFRADAWAKVIPIAAAAGTSDAKGAIEPLRAVIKDSGRIEPVFYVLLGETCAAVSRLDDALAAWKSAAESPVCASWPYPHVRQAETLLAMGRKAEAVDAATQALMIARQSPGINALWFEAQTERLRQLGGSDAKVDPASVLETLDRVNQQVEGALPRPDAVAAWERLQPSRVFLLARTGKRDQAISTARAALARELGKPTVERLASISVSERLGIEDECLQRAGGSMASPAVAFARAAELARSGQTDEGLKLMRDAAAAGSPESLVALAQFLELMGQKEAIAAWIDAADRHPENLAVQRAALGSAVAASDAAFADRLIARYQRLAGLEGPAAEDSVVRIARARVLLTRAGGVTLKDRDSAVALLSQVVAANPRNVEAKVALAKALMIADSKKNIRPDEPRALQQLVDALAVEPQSAPIALEAASLHLKMRDHARACSVLSTLAGDAVAPYEARLSAARMLLSQGGDSASLGLRALEDIDRTFQAQSRPTPPGVLVTLADEYARAKRDSQAELLLDRLIASAGVSADQLFAAAAFHQRRGNSAKLDQVLAIAAPDGKPVEVYELLQARLAEDRADFAAADAHFERAIAARADAGTTWRTYISSLLGRPNGSKALEVAQRARQALPTDPAISVLVEQARLAAAASDQSADFAPLISAMADDPEWSSAGEVLRALEEAKARGDLDRPAAVFDLAEKFPTQAGLQLYLAQHLLNADPQKASILILRAREAAPTDARIAKSAAQLWLALQRWPEMAAAATAWREADAGRSPEPDVALAEAKLHSGDFSAGMSALLPWVEAAAKNPAAPFSLSVLNMQTKLLIASGRAAEARQYLSPLLPKSADVRISVWLRAAGESLPDLNMARSWIEEVKPHTSSASVEEQLAIAAAHSMLASRFPGEAPALLSEARSHLGTVLQSPETVTAPVLEAFAVTCHRQKDLTAARDAYERALSLDPDRVICLNNLASLMLDEGTSLERATELADRAVQVRPELSSLVTLGSVWHARGVQARKSGQPGESEFRNAAQAFERAAKSAPADPQLLSRVAQAQADAGDFRASAASWERLASLPGLTGEVVAAAHNNRAAMLIRSGSERETLQQARTLIERVLASSQESAYLDTLGWIELQTSRRDKAIEAFRKALAGDGSMKSAQIGLAASLVSGSAEERREAMELASKVDPAELDQFLREKLQRVRAIVQVDKP